MKREKDRRINAGMISFKHYLVVWLFINAMLIGYYFLLQRTLGDSMLFYAVLIRHILLSVITVTVILEVAQRYFYGNPLRKIAKAARQIARGDFSVRIEPLRKDGKKDEIEVLVEDFNDNKYIEAQ